MCPFSDLEGGRLLLDETVTHQEYVHELFYSFLRLTHS